MLRNVGSYFLVNVLIPILTLLFEGSSQLWVSRSVLCDRLQKKMRLYLWGSLPVGVCLENHVGNCFLEMFCIQYLLTWENTDIASTNSEKIEQIGKCYFKFEWKKSKCISFCKIGKLEKLKQSWVFLSSWNSTTACCLKLSFKKWKCVISYSSWRIPVMALQSHDTRESFSHEVKYFAFIFCW